MKNEHADWLSKLPVPVRQHVQHLQRIRRDFVANVSHELRTPLTVLHGYLEMLADQANQCSEVKVAANVLIQMQQQTERMQSIIEDLLLLSKIESDEHFHENRQPVYLAELIREVVSINQRLIDQKQHLVTVNLNEELAIAGYRAELHSLVSDLLTNAIKYSDQGSQIKIDWQYVQSDKQAILSVSDNGVGIEEKYIPRLTERFYRIDKARSRGSGGTGLGLAIVKHILIHHDAELKINSELGQGSVFQCIFDCQFKIEVVNNSV